MTEQRRAVPARALLCLLLVLAAFGVATPSARAEARASSGSAVVQAQATTTGAVRARAAGRPMAAGATSSRDRVGSDRAAYGVAAPAGSAAGSAGPSPVPAVLLGVRRPLAPLLLGQLPRPPSSTYSSRHLTGSPSRAPPAVAGT